MASSYSSSPVNCSSPLLDSEWWDDLPVEIDPDIAGKGVIINFLATAYITWGLLLFNYIFAYDPEIDPLLPPNYGWPGAGNSDDCHDFSPNPIDVVILGCIRPRPKWRRTARAFDECILSMCDIQVITGLGILVSGFVMAFSGQMYAFHWNIIASLGLFTAITHLSGLTVLRGYLSRQPRVKMARFVLMSIFIVLLSIATLPTGFFGWDSQVDFYDPRQGLTSCAAPKSPASCYFNFFKTLEFCAANMTPDQPMWQTDAMPGMIAGNTFLLLGFFTRCVKFFRPLSTTVNRSIRGILSKFGRELIQITWRVSIRFFIPDDIGPWSQIFFDLAILPLSALFLSLRFNIDLFNSMFAEVFSVLIALTWSTHKLFGILMIGDFGNSHWGFGQLMGLVTIASPLLLVAWRFLEGSVIIETRSTPSNYGRGENQHRILRDLEINLNSVTEISSASHSHQRREENRHCSLSSGTESIFYLLSRENYFRAVWQGPLIFIASASLFACTVLMHWAANYRLGIFNQLPGESVNGPFTTMFVAWFIFPGMMGYLVLGYPFACAATILFGMYIQRLPNILPASRRVAILLAAGTVHVLYFLTNFRYNPVWIIIFHAHVFNYFVDLAVPYFSLTALLLLGYFGVYSMSGRLWVTISFCFAIIIVYTLPFLLRNLRVI